LEVNTANSGACALVAHIRKRNIHIANIGIFSDTSFFTFCLGDCIAVLGILLPTGIIARQLNKPHTVENIDEVTRIRSEHPSGEFGNLLKSIFYTVDG
jgi:serine/threonine protein phosphatase PrpC